MPLGQKSTRGIAGASQAAREQEGTSGYTAVGTEHNAQLDAR